MEEEKAPFILKNETWHEKLFFYQKAEVLFALTFHFAAKYLPSKGDRTVDQMVQAARSGKQNIIEGFADGVTSTELQLKLLNVARASLKELRADYEDFLQTRHLTRWQSFHPRFEEMLKFCRTHNKVNEYEPYFDRWNAEELCNIALTLLHIVDKMMMSYLKRLEQLYVTQGGIKERMYAARTGYRKGIDEELQRLRDENKKLRQQVPILEQRIEELLREKRHLEVLLQQERMKKK
jgi:four helix bundle suffix protein